MTCIRGIVTCCLLAFTGMKLLSSIGVLCLSFLNVAIQTLTIKKMMKVENAMGIMMAEIQRIKNKSLDVKNARLNYVSLKRLPQSLGTIQSSGFTFSKQTLPRSAYSLQQNGSKVNHHGLLIPFLPMITGTRPRTPSTASLPGNMLLSPQPISSANKVHQLDWKTTASCQTMGQAWQCTVDHPVTEEL